MCKLRAAKLNKPQTACSVFKHFVFFFAFQLVILCSYNYVLTPFFP